MEWLESIAFLLTLLNYNIYTDPLFNKLQLHLFVNNIKIFIFNLKSDRFLELDFRECETVFWYCTSELMVLRYNFQQRN